MRHFGSILGGFWVHFCSLGGHFCYFLGVFLGACFLGLSNGSRGAIESLREPARACESLRERFMHSPGEGFREGKPLPKGTLGRRGLKELGWGI